MIHGQPLYPSDLRYFSFTWLTLVIEFKFIVNLLPELLTFETTDEWLRAAYFRGPFRLKWKIRHYPSITTLGFSTHSPRTEARWPVFLVLPQVVVLTLTAKCHFHGYQITYHQSLITSTTTISKTSSDKLVCVLAYQFYSLQQYWYIMTNER